MSEEAELIFICPMCKAHNRQNARFCRRCGRSRAELEEDGNAGADAAHKQLCCLSCLCPIRVTDSFCSYCGAPQPFRILPNMKVCRDCGVQMPSEANYCYACGVDVGVSSTRQVPVPVELFQEEDPDSLPTFEA